MMKKLITIFIVLMFLLSTINFNISAKDSTKMTIYVDNETEPGHFSTIDDARKFIQNLNKNKGDIYIEIADGTYEIDNTIVFTEQDSGSKNCKIHYIAAKNAHPVISGGKKISGEWRDEGNGIYSTTLNRNKKLRSIYVNGERRYMTSKVTKALGPSGEYKINKGEAGWAWEDGTRHNGVLLKPGAVSVKTRNPEDIELMTQTRWNSTIVCVDKLERHGLNVFAALQMPYGAIAQTLGWGNEYQFKKNNMIYNVFEHLDEPGKFYFDKAGKRLYYYPTENENINDIDVVVPELETLIDIHGRNTNTHVSNISFEGLTFAYTDWNLYEVDGSHGRATNQGAASLFAYAQEDWHGYLYRAYDVGPAAITMSGCDNIDFFNNTVAHTGNEGLSIINDCNNISVGRNMIFDTAGASILIGHPQHVYIGDKNSDYGVLSDKEKYDKDTEAPCKDIYISDNLLRDTSRLFWGVAGIMVYFCDHLEFTHNTVINTTYSGISLGWGWWNMNGDDDSVVPGIPSTTMKNNIIKYNKFENTITTLSDAGAIYTIGDMPGTIISENYIDTIGSPFSNNAYHIRGIHIDEGTKHVYGEKNVIKIDSNHACIDCGDWGRKGYNKWVNNYSNSESYTTTNSYETGTIITNPHYVPDCNWNDEALSIIDNSGITKDVLKKMDNKLLTKEIEYIKAIPTYKVNIPLIVISAVTGIAAIGAGITIATMKIRKKRK